MIKVPYDEKVAMMYNFIHHSPDDGNYKPNTNWDEHTSNLQALLLTNLPRNSTNKTLTDIGSGAGKWTALLSPYFDQIVSIEPRKDMRDWQEKLYQKLQLENIDIYQDSMPDCISKLNCQAALLVDSLYLTANWMSVYTKLLDDPYLQWLAIADGPDKSDVFSDSIWNTPFHAINNRRPLLQGDEWHMSELAEQQGWTSRLYNILECEPAEPKENADRWLLILER